MRRLGVLVLLAAACGGNDDPTKATYWIEKLDSKVEQERVDALKELGKIGDKAAVPAVAALLDEDGPWQSDAAYTLGQLGDASVVQKLVAKIDYAVGTNNDKVSRNKNRTNLNIARALGMLRAKEAVPQLLRLVDTQYKPTREQVIRALGEIGDPAATQTLAQLALNDSEPFLRKTAIEALGTLRDPAAVPALVQCLYIEVPGISFYNEARHSLVQLGAAADAKLRETLEGKNAEVSAIRLPSGSGLAEGALEAKAASVLGYLKAKDADKVVLPVFERLAQRYARRDREPVYASVPGALIEMSYALGNLGSAAAVPALEKLARDEDARMRKAATDALVMLGSRKSFAALVAAAKTGDDAARKVTLVAASRLGGAADMEAFAGLSATGLGSAVEEHKVRLAAAAECKEDAACWLKKAGDANVHVRERALYELGWLRVADAKPVLLQAAADADPDVRMAALVAVDTLGAGGADAQALAATLEQWSGKIEHAEVNRELKLLLARLGSQGST